MFERRGKTLRGAPMQIERELDRYMEIAADTLGIAQTKVETAIAETVTSKRRSPVARAAIDLFRPAKRGGNGRIVPKGAPEIPSEVVASFPDDVMLAELEESTEIERFDDAVVEIRATDRDAAERGWAGRLISGSVKTKRLPLKLYPTVDRDRLATRDQVRVEAIVESRLARISHR